jgi:bifunctional pyridoxal-dependent enzyme with beta-cystathionase and maltose regulon repressor activities
LNGFSQHAKVAVAPGIDFGLNGEGYVRFSYANSLGNIHQGLSRLRQYLVHAIGHSSAIRQAIFVLTGVVDPL